MVKGHALVDDIVDKIEKTNFASSRRLRELQAHEYPSKVPYEFLGLLLELHKDITVSLEYLRQQVDNLPAAADTSSHEVSIRRYGQLVYYLHGLLEIVDEARVEYVSPSPVILVRQLSRGLDRVKFLVLPEYEYNFCYTEILEDLRKAIQDAAGKPSFDAIDAFGKSLAVLRFPLAERDSILLIPMLGHEIGHALTHQHKLIEPILTNVQVGATTIDDIVQGLLDALAPAGDTPVPATDIVQRERIRAFLVELTTATIAGWIDELLCDAIAFLFLGPVYLLSFAEFFLSLQGLDSFAMSHPPNRMRLGLLLDIYDQLGFSVAIRDYKGISEDVLNAVQDRIEELSTRVNEKQTTPPQKTVYAAAHPAVASLLVAIKKAAIDVVGLGAYDKTRLIGEVPSLCQLLAVFVPPCVTFRLKEQVTDPAPLMSILNAGAFFKLSHMEQLYAGFGATTSDEKLAVSSKLDDLVSKAIELAHLYSLLPGKGAS